jgi:hypothetical protein
VRMNSKLFQYNLFSKAKQQPQTIVLPEVCSGLISKRAILHENLNPLLHRQTKINEAYSPQACLQLNEDR